MVAITFYKKAYDTCGITELASNIKSGKYKATIFLNYRLPEKFMRTEVIDIVSRERFERRYDELTNKYNKWEQTQ